MSQLGDDASQLLAMLEVKDGIREIRQGLEAALPKVKRMEQEHAELVEAVKSGLHFVKWAEEHGHMGAPSARDQLEAVLARVRGET